MGKIHLLHVKSCKPTVAGGNEPKLPTIDHIEYGELAINYGKGFETLSIRNNEDEIFPFNMRKATIVQDTYLSGVSVNDIDAEVTDHVAELSISGSDINVGDYESVEYNPLFSGAVNVSGSQTVADAFNAVETTVSELTDKVIEDEQVTSKAIKKLAEAAGTIDENNEIAYNAHDDANYISAATNIDEATVILDGAIHDLAEELEDKIDNVNVNGVLGTVENGISNVTISGSDINVGDYKSVEYNPSFSGAVNVSSGQTVADAFNAVETTISGLTDRVIEDEQVTSKAIKKLAEAAGTIDGNDEIVYNVHDDANYISAATNIDDATLILDGAIYDLSCKSLENIVVNGINGTVSNNIASVDLDGHYVQIGQYETVAYPQEFISAETVSSADTVSDAVNKVENTLATLTTEVIKNELVVSNAIIDLTESAGLVNEDNNIVYEANPNANYINTAQNLVDADNILDAAINALADATRNDINNVVVNGVTGTVTNKVANVTLGSSDVNINNYTAVTYPSIMSGAPTVNNGDSISQAFNDVENAISGLAYYVENHVDEYEPNTDDTYISAATSLQNADDILDAALADLSGKSLTTVNVNGISGTVVNNIQTIEVDGFDINVGAEYSAATYPSAFTSATPVNTSDSVSEALENIETSVAHLTNEVIENERVTEKGFEKVARAAGITKEDGSIAYVINTSAHYINIAGSLKDADDILDTQLYGLVERIVSLESQIENLANAINALDARVTALENQ